MATVARAPTPAPRPPKEPTTSTPVKNAIKVAPHTPVKKTDFHEVVIFCRGGEAVKAPRQLLEEGSEFVRQVFSSSTSAPVMVFPDASVDQLRSVVDYLRTGDTKYEYLLPYTARLYTTVSLPEGHVSPGTYFAVTFLPKTLKNTVLVNKPNTVV